MTSVNFDPGLLSAQEMSFLLNGLVVPRPIAWVCTLNPAGTRNLAPHSYFNAVSCHPPILQFTSTHSSPHHGAGYKDSLRNVGDTGEFVVNVVSEDLAQAMNATAIDCPPGVDEFELAGLAAAPSCVVQPPRVAAAKAALECRLRMLLPMGDATMVFGDIVHVYLDESVWIGGRVAADRLKPLGRLGGSSYSLLRETLQLRRPAWGREV